MKILITYGVPFLLILLGGQVGGIFNHRILGSILGLLASLFYLSLIMKGDLLMMKGSKAIRNKEIKKGLSYYEKAIKSNTRTDYIIYACYTFLRFGKEEECIKYLDYVKKNKKLTSSQEKEFLSIKALYFWKTGDMDEAESLFRKAHAVYPSSQTYSHLGFILLDEKKYDEAYLFNKEAMEYNDSDPSIVDNMAMSHFYKGENDEALSLYEKIMEKGTRFPVIHYNYALCLEKAGKLEDAIDELNESLRYNFSHIASVSKESVQNKLSALENKIKNIKQ